MSVLFPFLVDFLPGEETSTNSGIWSSEFNLIGSAGESENSNSLSSTILSDSLRRLFLILLEAILGVTFLIGSFLTAFGVPVSFSTSFLVDFGVRFSSDTASFLGVTLKYFISNYLLSGSFLYSNISELTKNKFHSFEDMGDNIIGVKIVSVTAGTTKYI